MTRETTGNEAPKAIYLFADSQLLFWRQSERLFCDRIRDELRTNQPFAAYVGASNGDDSTFFGLFRSAMSGIGISDCAMINACFPPEDGERLATADLILLAGGDMERGWNIFNAVGMKEAITAAYSRGSLLVGVSAGAVQLGFGGYASADGERFVNTFAIVPFIVDAHEERSDWRDLRRAVTRERGNARGIGIPSGGGMIYHPDRTLEPLRNSLAELSWEGGRLRYDLLLPTSQVPSAHACDVRGVLDRLT